jgi:hypothetical protein
MMGMRFRTLWIVAAVITLAAFAMPHSPFGSEIRNRQFLVSYSFLPHPFLIEPSAAPQRTRF